METISKYQTGYFENIIAKISELVKKILQAEYVSIIITFLFLFYTLYNQSIILFISSFIASALCIFLSVKILTKAKKTEKNSKKCIDKIKTLVYYNKN